MLKQDTINAMITGFTLHSIAVIMETKKTIQQYKAILEQITLLHGVFLYSTTPEDEIAVCEIAERKNLDFDDALQYFVASKFSLELISFDDDFDATDLKRVEPKDVVASHL